jgi:hypothetical protein
MTQVIDNSDVTGYVQTAGWSSTGAGGHNSGYVYAASGSGSEIATYTFTGLTPGSYKVGITWVEFANRATNTPVNVYDSDGTTLLGTFTINQQNAPDGSASAPDADPAVWQYLNGLGFTISGTSFKVTIDNNANGFVIADAVYITATAAPATSYTLTGPTTGQINAASDNFTVQPNGNYIGTITPHAATVTGTFSPSSLTWTGDSVAQEFSFTPTSGTGTATISTTSSPGLTDPSSRPYVVIPVGPATYYTLTGPVTGYQSAASRNFTVTPNALYTGTITPHATGVTGTFTPTSLSWTSSSAAKTFTFTPTSGTGTATISTTSSPALTDATSIPYRVFSTSGQQTIDSTWLTANALAFGGPPYLLGLAFGSYAAATSYLLATDVTTQGVAFYFLAANILLDLGTHTVTYDNSTATPVVNGGFETDSIGATSITGWNVTGASGAVITASITGFWGSKMLQIPGITASTTKTIISDPIAIPAANVTYCALINPKVTANFATVTLSVIDNVTSAVLGSAASSDANRGTAAFVEFTPTTTHAVKLKVDCTSTSGTAVVNLDHADLTRSRVAGIGASPSFYNLSNEIVTNATIIANASNCSNATIRNGTITQSTGRAYGGSPIFAWAITGLTIDNVAMTSAGSSTNQIEGNFATGPWTIANTTLTNNMDLVDDRARAFAGISLRNFAGDATILSNTLRGHHHNGIAVSGAYLPYTDPSYLSSPSPITSCLINNNDIRVDTYWTDGYAIGVAGTASFEWGSNTVIPINGRGLFLDGNSGITRNGNIHDNYVEARERPNLEYDATGMEATALRVRTGTIKNCNFTNNIFAGHTGIGKVWAATGCRFTLINGWNGSDHINDNSNNVFTGNIFRGIVDDLDPDLPGGYTSQAWGLSVSRVDFGTGSRFVNNTFESNNVSLHIGDNDGAAGDIHDIDFLSSTILKSSNGVAMTYYGITVGDWGTNVTDIRLYDLDYAGAAPPGVTFLSTPAKDITIGGLLDLTVDNLDTTPAVGATVTVHDSTTALVYTGTTNGSGQIAGIPLLFTKYSQLTSDPTVITPTSYNPMTVAATLSGHNASSSLTMSDDATLTLTLDGGGGGGGGGGGTILRLFPDVGTLSTQGGRAAWLMPIFDFQPVMDTGTIEWSGPSFGTVGVPSSNFTVTVVGGMISGTLTAMMSDAANGGTFTPTTVTITEGSRSATFTYTAVSTGVKTLSMTNNGGLTDPDPLSFTAVAEPTPPAAGNEGVSLGSRIGLLPTAHNAIEVY